MLKLPLKYQFRFPGRIYFVTLFLILLLTGVYLLYEFHRQLTITAKQQFIGLASANLITTDQTIEELKANLTLARTNYQNYSQGNNYNLLIEDGQNNLEQIGLIKNDIEFQNNLMSEAQTPDEYETLKSDFTIYYEKLNNVLANLESNIMSELDILKILNTSDTSQNITLTALWQEGTSEEIIDFYEQLMKEVDLALTKLYQIDDSKVNNKYYQLNTDYLKLVRLTSSEIISTLNSESNVILGAETIENKELAYQIAINAQAEMDQLIRDIIEEGSQLYSLDEDSVGLQALLTIQQALELKVKNIYQKLYIESNETIIPKF